MFLVFPDGELRRIPVSWTSLRTPNPYELLSEPPLVTVAGLQELAK